MKRFLSLLLLCVCGCFFTGCSEKTETYHYPVNAADLMDIPVISIETKNGLDFVTEPVAAHVAASIASWTPGYKMPPAPYYETCTVTVTDGGQPLLSAADAQVKVRGNWTTSYDKKPLRMKFTEPQNLLGVNDGAAFKNWLLLAEYKDGSMLRNKTALALAQELLADNDLYASDAALVEVVINGQYWGVYLLAEQQQVDNDRVNITEPESGYTGTDIGYFLEMDGYFRNEDPLQQVYVSYADNAPLIPYDGNGGSGRTMACLSDEEHGQKSEIGFAVKSDIYSPEQRDFIESYLNNAYYILYAGAYHGEAYIFNEDYSGISLTTEISPREAIEKVIDVSSLVDIYILNELLCDADVYWSSFFLSVDFGPEGNKKLTFEAPWDFDSAMGLKDRCLDGTGFYASNIVPDVNGGAEGGGDYDTINPWLVVLAYEDWYQELIRTAWTDAYDSGVFTRIFAMLEADQTQCGDAFSRNYERWNNILNNHAFRSELSYRAAMCTTQEEAADFLSEWLQSRVTFLNSIWHS